MWTITVVTTFHKPGLDLYGQRFIDSFSQRVDKQIKLVVYAEDCIPNNPDPTQVTILDQKQALPKLVLFKDRWNGVPKAHGWCKDSTQKFSDKTQKIGFKWDAVRFSNKVYAVFDACEKKMGDWIIWMDADSFIHSDWSYNDFKKLLPDDKYITYVGRGRGSQTWPECGFYGMNLNHPVCHSFLKDFEHMYQDADNGIFTLEEWHDSYVFGEILKKYKGANADHDYSADMYLKEAKTGGGGHPLINTELGKYMDHMKGERKKDGRSKSSDLMVNRTEKYWK
jgi:hypothetical protein